MVTSPGVGWKDDSATGGVLGLMAVLTVAGRALGVTDVLLSAGG